MESGDGIPRTHERVLPIRPRVSASVPDTSADGATVRELTCPAGRWFLGKDSKLSFDVPAAFEGLSVRDHHHKLRSFQ